MSLETWANSQVWYTVCSREVVWPLVHKRAHRQWIFSQATSTLCFSFGSEQKSVLGIWHFYGHMGCLHLNEIIRMSDWHQQMVDGAEFWISCKWLKALRKASQWHPIKCSGPSTICWHVTSECAPLFREIQHVLFALYGAIFLQKLDQYRNRARTVFCSIQDITLLFRSDQPNPCNQSIILKVLTTRKYLKLEFRLQVSSISESSG